jgi:uncharacterized integral membrane protein
MTKSYHIFETKRIIGIVLLLLIYIVSNAQEQSALTKPTTLIKDSNIGYFIIGGILGFGITGYIIVSIIEKYRNKSEKTPTKAVNTSYGRHHHNKVVKKSA